MRNNSGELEECSEREINRGGGGQRETERERGEAQKERHACESFHGEMRTEALLCWQPQGADKTPGREKEKGMTGSVTETRGI